MTTRNSAATRRSLLRALARTGLSIAAAGAFGHSALGQPVMMNFDDIHPDFSMKLFVPDGWTAGKRRQGYRVLSETPRLVLFGGIGDRDKRILGELLYLVRRADYDPLVVFAETAHQQFQASAIKTVPAGIDSSQRRFVINYRDPKGRDFIERVTIGRKIAVALFISTVPNQALLNDVNDIMTKSSFVVS